MNLIPTTLLALGALAAAAFPATAQEPSSKTTFTPAADDGARLQAPTDRTADWNAFQERRPGVWRAHWNHATGTPNAVFGPDIAIADWRGNTIEEARRHALAVLHEEATLLGLGDCELRESIGARMGRTWSFTFDQWYRGLPVIGGRADVRVGSNGRIAMFGSAAFTIPTAFATTPAITAETATVAAWQTMAEPLAANPGGKAPAAPRLVIQGDVEASQRSAVHLAWEVAVRNLDANGEGTLGRYYVDAVNGTVLRFVDDKHACGAGCTHASHRGDLAASTVIPVAPPLPLPTIVNVVGHVRTGLSPTATPIPVPLAGLEINVPSVGMRTTDHNGRFTMDISAAVLITIGALDGRHHQAIGGSSAPSVSAVIQPGSNSTIFVFDQNATTAQLAHTNTTFWVNRVNEWARTILGDSPQMTTASNIDATVNIAQTCNAYYDTGANSINFYGAGGGCSNTAYSTVILHEWGHGLDDRYGGISQTNGLSEGWGDIVSMYHVDDPEVGLGLFTAGVPLRTGTNTRQYPTGGTVHQQGESWMGFAWKLRDALALRYSSRGQAIARTNDIVLGSIVADATNQANAVLEVFLADDDDAMLNNGTPNDIDLVWACNQHSLPVPPLQGPTNDYCAGAIAVVQGINGPFDNTGASAIQTSWSCGPTAADNDVWFKFTTPWPGTLTVSTCGQTTLDTKLQLLSGTCGAFTVLQCNDNSCGNQSTVTAIVTNGTYWIQVGAASTGTFGLDVNFVGPIAASSTSHGAGCGAASKAFYELFPTNTFDLTGQGLRLVNMGTHYVAQPGGSFLPLGANTFQTSHGDDTVLNFVLSVPMPYPGGSSQFLEVCSNGFVSVAPGNGTGFNPTAAAWLGSARARWGTWRDFNPAATGSGRIHYDINGPIAYVTWNGVYTYGTTMPSTWQIQFNQFTGDVTMVWQSMPTVNLPTLVGYAAQGPNSDLGSMDLSAALPATFYTGAFNGSPLALAGTLPQIGTTLSLTTTSFPPTSPVGLQLLGVQGYWNGIDLSVLGMPGCYQHSEALVIHTLLPVGGQAVYTMPIPNQLNLTGFQLKAQSAALVAGYNAGGFTTSNGVWMTIGI